MTRPDVVRLAAVVVTYLALAVVIIAGLYGFTLLMWVAFGPDPVSLTGVQLPTL